MNAEEMLAQLLKSNACCWFEDTDLCFRARGAVSLNYAAWHRKTSPGSHRRARYLRVEARKACGCYNNLPASRTQPFFSFELCGHLDGTCFRRRLKTLRQGMSRFIFRPSMVFWRSGPGRYSPSGRI